jgi:hypothetical protein
MTRSQAGWQATSHVAYFRILTLGLSWTQYLELHGEMNWKVGNSAFEINDDFSLIPRRTGRIEWARCKSSSL